MLAVFVVVSLLAGVFAMERRQRPVNIVSSGAFSIIGQLPAVPIPDEAPSHDAKTTTVPLSTTTSHVVTTNPVATTTATLLAPAPSVNGAKPKSSPIAPHVEINDVDLTNPYR
jgi:hypothetical protein